jgi:nucleotide-binding universal stress UspA family protein
VRFGAAYRSDALEEELAARATADGSDRARQTAQQHLDEAAKFARSVNPTLLLETVAVPGTPASVLLEEAQRSVMIVVGSRRHGRVHRIFSGSTGAATSARVSCPVLVVCESASRSLGETRVVVGIDGPASQGAAEFAFREAKRMGASLTAVHAWHLNSADLASLVSPVVGREKLETRSHATLAEILTPLSAAYPEVDVRRYVVEGSPVEQLEKLSANASLLVVGSRGLSPLSALVLGSVSRETITRAHCPVAIIHSRTSSRPALLTSG